MKQEKIKTRFSQEEVMQRILMFIQLKGEVKNERAKFTGKIYTERFELMPMRVSKYRDPPRPLILGEFEASGDGCNVVLSFKLGSLYRSYIIVFIGGFIVACVSFTLRWDYLIVQDGYRREQISPEARVGILGVLGLLIVLGLRFLYYTACKEALYNLKIILKAKEITANEDKT